MNVRPARWHVIVAFLLLPLKGEAAQVVEPDLPPAFQGPAPPVAPEVISRDAAGRATVRAVRLTEPLQVDGRLEEAIYSSVPSISEFIQNDPQEGQPATEKTEVWLFYDHDAVYVSARCWETHPERMVANDMRRDGGNIIQNDNFAFAFDTFLDRRNAVYFEVTPVGGREDGQVTNERQLNKDWNPVWDVAVGRFEGGWTVETAVPFKSIRYRPGRIQVWGLQIRRISKWKNESSHLVPIPAALPLLGLFRMSLAATLVGIEAPPPAKNLKSSRTSSAISRATRRRDHGLPTSLAATPGST